MLRSFVTYPARYCIPISCRHPAIQMEGPPAKRRRLSTNSADVVDEDAIGGHSARDLDRIPKSLSRAISPPKRKREAATAVATARRVLIPSPFRLTTIRDLPPASNADAVSLGDLIGDPLIAECWEFDYLHDIDFLMSHLDEDTRSLTKVHVVHGFWKREDPNKIFLEVNTSNTPYLRSPHLFTLPFAYVVLRRQLAYLRKGYLLRNAPSIYSTVHISQK